MASLEVWVVIPHVLSYERNDLIEDEIDNAIEHNLLPKTFEDEESARQYMRDVAAKEDTLERYTGLEVIIQKTEFVPLSVKST